MEFAPKSLADKPIKLPGSPFWIVFKRFGRDEAIAMLVNVIGTAIASFLTANPLYLSVAGPIVEKIGFFPAHFREAWIIYKTTPENKRKKLSFYFKKALRGGTVSLIEDVLIHDPVYVGLMYLGLLLCSGIPVWLLAALSFVIAVVIVSFLEVGATELRYYLFKRKLLNNGFHAETYYESRFCISSEMDPTIVIDTLSRQFQLNKWGKLVYSDLYLGNSIPDFSGRLAKLRLRQRTPYEISNVNIHDVVERDGFLQTAQVVFTRASELHKDLEQWRYFPLKKDKFYFLLDQTMPRLISEIEDLEVRKILDQIRDRTNPPSAVSFSRLLAQNSDLLASVDELSDDKFYLLELKSYDSIKLRAAMRFVMMEFPVVQTTYGKHEMLEKS